MTKPITGIGLGHNNPPAFETCSLELEALLASARKAVTDFSSIDTQEVADNFDGFFLQLRAARDRCEKEREREKAPILSAGKAIDARWNELKASAQKAMDFISPIIAKWKSRQEDIRLAAAQQAAIALAKAQQAAAKARSDAEELARKAEQGKLQGSKADPIAAAIAAENLEVQAKEAERHLKEAATPQKTSFVTESGKTRSVNMRVYYSAKLTNARAALGFFMNDPRILEALQLCANAAVRADQINLPPGVELIKEERPV